MNWFKNIQDGSFHHYVVSDGVLFVDGIAVAEGVIG